MKFSEVSKASLEGGPGLTVKVYKVDDLDVEYANRRVTRDGEVLDVSGLNFDVLKALIDAGTEPISGDELAVRAWGQNFVSGETVAKRIALLREALGDDARMPRYVRTVRGKGYALVSPVLVLERADGKAQAERSWLMLAGFGVTLATLTAFLVAALMRTDYSVTMVDGATGHVDHTIVRQWTGESSVDLVDPVTGDVLLQSKTTPEVRAEHAHYLLELAELRYSTGDLDAARRYARAAVEIDRELSPSLERFGGP